MHAWFGIAHLMRPLWHSTECGARLRVLSLLTICTILPWASGPASGSDRDDAIVEAAIEPVFASVGDANVIPDGVVSTLAEDHSGLIWIGTPAGLVRYDGYRFRHLMHQRDDPHSIGGNFVRATLVARDGRLWVGTEADGLSVYDPVSERFSVFRHRSDDSTSLGEGAVTSLAEDHDGALWVGTRGGGLHRLPAGGSAFEHFRHQPEQPDSLPDNRVQALLVDARGDLWVGSWNGLARRRQASDGFERVYSAPGEGLAGRTIWALLMAADGRLWVGSQQGDIAVIDPTNGSGITVPQAGEGGDSGAIVYALAQQGADQVVVGRSSGLELRDAHSGALRQRFRHDPARPSTLAGSDVRALLHDRAGWLWVGGYGSGVQRFDPRNRGLQLRRQQEGFGGVFREANVRSVLTLENGHVWVGTQEHGIAVFDTRLRLIDGFAVDPERPGALGGGRVTGLAQAPDGTIWVGSDSGLHRFVAETRSFERFKVGQGRIRRLLSDTDGTLWIATDDGLFERDAATAVIQRIERDDGESLGGDINALALDPSGQLWVGGEQGLFLRPTGAKALQTVRSDAAASLAHPTVLGLLVDNRGQLWVDTSQGLHRMLEHGAGGARFERTSARLGIGGRPFGANLLEDERGRLWTHEFVYDPASQHVHELSIADGVDIGTGWFRAYAKARDGQMHFGGSKGLLIADPERFDPLLFAPPVVATDLKINGVSRPVGMLSQGLELAPDQRSFSIEFAALDYSAPERNRYRYRLLGFDADWIDTDASYRVASYNNLWPGSYTLEVLGSNRGGVFTEQGLRIPVRVVPAYWQTAWFAALVLLGLGALTYAGVRWRTARVDARARELQRVIEERTSELRAAKDSAEQALAELTGAQRQLIASEKMASLGALVAGIAHEINTPIGIAVTAASHLQESSRSFADKADTGKLTRSDLVSWRNGTEEACRLILGSLQRANTLIGSFKQVAVDQSSEQRRSFDLRSFLEEVQTSLRPIYRRTPFSLSVECADGIQLDTYPGALFQIFTNLVNNSLLHGFHQRERGSMRISAQADDARVVLQYSDDGHGMHAAVAEHAFDPFYTTRRGSGGSGLGLHLVNNLVGEMLGGRVSLETQPGQGCRFIIELPLRAP